MAGRAGAAADTKGTSESSVSRPLRLELSDYLVGLIEVKNVATVDSIADVPTKPLSWGEFAPNAVRLLEIVVSDFPGCSITMYNVT